MKLACCWFNNNHEESDCYSLEKIENFMFAKMVDFEFNEFSTALIHF